MTSVHTWRVPSPSACSPFRSDTCGKGLWEQPQLAGHSCIPPCLPAQAPPAPSCSVAVTGLTSCPHSTSVGHEPLLGWQLWAPGPRATMEPPPPIKLPPPRCSQLAGLADRERAGCLACGGQACRQTTHKTRDQMEAAGPEKRQSAGQWDWKGGPLPSFHL